MDNIAKNPGSPKYLTVEQVKLEASKAAVKAIDDLKSDAVTRLKKVQDSPDRNDRPQEKTGKKEDVEVQK